MVAALFSRFGMACNGRGAVSGGLDGLAAKFGRSGEGARGGFGGPKGLPEGRPRCFWAARRQCNG